MSECPICSHPIEVEETTTIEGVLIADERRVGVIVGLDPRMSTASSVVIARALSLRFPGVRFACVAGAQSIAFEFDPEAEPEAFEP